jgi:hypothetical protein
MVQCREGKDQAGVLPPHREGCPAGGLEKTEQTMPAVTIDICRTDQCPDEQRGDTTREHPRLGSRAAWFVTIDPVMTYRQACRPPEASTSLIRVGAHGALPVSTQARRTLAVMRWHGHRKTLLCMDSHHELTPEQASRMTATAVTADLEYWARNASVDGRVGLNDLTRALDVIREASTPDVGR